MASTADLVQLSTDPAFVDHVRFLAVGSALAIMSEDPATTNHTIRIAYAIKVLNGTLGFVNLAFAILTNTTIGGEAVLADHGTSIPDGDLTFTIASLWDALALAAVS